MAWDEHKDWSHVNKYIENGFQFRAYSKQERDRHFSSDSGLHTATDAPLAYVNNIDSSIFLLKLNEAITLYLKNLKENFLMIPHDKLSLRIRKRYIKLRRHLTNIDDPNIVNQNFPYTKIKGKTNHENYLNTDTKGNPKMECLDKYDKPNNWLRNIVYTDYYNLLMGLKKQLFEIADSENIMLEPIDKFQFSCLTSDLYDHLVKANFINKSEFNKTGFNKVFSDTYNRQKVNLNIEKQEFRFLINLLNSHKSITVPSNHKWVCAANCFTLNGEQYSSEQMKHFKIRNLSDTRKSLIADIVNKSLSGPTK